jgi:hypothetical protein
MAVYRPQNLPPRQNEDISDVTIVTPGSQPVIYQWNDNYGETKVQITPNPNAGEDRVVTNDQ